MDKIKHARLLMEDVHKLFTPTKLQDYKRRKNDELEMIADKIRKGGLDAVKGYDLIKVAAAYRKANPHMSEKSTSQIISNWQNKSDDGGKNLENKNER
jgi:hypothetical protein